MRLNKYGSIPGMMNKECRMMNDEVYCTSKFNIPCSTFDIQNKKVMRLVDIEQGITNDE